MTLGSHQQSHLIARLIIDALGPWGQEPAGVPKSYSLWAAGLKSRPTKGSEMWYSAPVDDFRLAYERSGSGPPVVLLHGWPGDHTDWDQLVPTLTDAANVLAPDLRGFGQSDKYQANPEEIYSAHGQARAVAALMDELGLKDAVVAGYDVGGAVSQTLASMRPDLVKALVVSPHLPGAGKRVLELGPVREFWYTSFHQLDLAGQLIDGTRDAVRVYLRHFWSHWSGQIIFWMTSE